MKKEELIRIILISVLSFLFVVLGVFVFIIVQADWAEYKLGRLDGLQIFKDAIFIGWWAALFSLIKYIYKQNRRK